MSTLNLIKEDNNEYRFNDPLIFLDSLKNRKHIVYSIMKIRNLAKRFNINLQEMDYKKEKIASTPLIMMTRQH